MARYHQGIYTPVHPEKYKGEQLPKYRSSWELDAMKFFDFSDSCVEWISEPTNFGSGRGGIPYSDPITGKQKIYIPDFIITQIDRHGNIKKKMIEIKPLHEADSKYSRNATDDIIRMRNEAKWGAATAWCMRHGLDFIVLTEAEMFLGGANRVVVNPRIKSQARKITPAAIKRFILKENKQKAKSRGLNTGKRVTTTKSARVSRGTKVRKV